MIPKDKPMTNETMELPAIDFEREKLAFEARMRRFFDLSPATLEEREWSGRLYKHDAIQTMWDGWRARAEQDARRPTEPGEAEVEVLRDSLKGQGFDAGNVGSMTQDQLLGWISDISGPRQPGMDALLGVVRRALSSATPSGEAVAPTIGEMFAVVRPDGLEEKDWKGWDLAMQAMIRAYREAAREARLHPASVSSWEQGREALIEALELAGVDEDGEFDQELYLKAAAALRAVPAQAGETAEAEGKTNGDLIGNLLEEARAAGEDCGPILTHDATEDRNKLLRMRATMLRCIRELSALTASRAPAAPPPEVTP